MASITDIFRGPYAGILVIAAGILIAVIAGFSASRKTNLIIAWITAASYIAAVYFIIRNHLAGGPSSGDLLNTGLAETIISSAVIFFGLNVLFFLGMEKLPGNNFSRLAAMLSFSIIAILMVVMAENTVLFTAASIITILSIFNLLAASGRDDDDLVRHTGGIGLRWSVPAGLLLMGSSLMAGTGYIASITSSTVLGKAEDPLFMMSVLFLAAALYFYFFMYPFQGMLLRFSRRAGAFSDQVLWLLYIPAGVVMLIKLDTFFGIFYGGEGIYGYTVLAVLAFLNLMGAGIGCIRSFDIKRIISLFLLFQLGSVILVKAAGFTGKHPAYPSQVFDLSVLIIIIIVFPSLSMLARELERGGGRGMVDRARGFFRKNIYTGVCLTLILIWWLAANIYMFFLRGPIPGGIYGAEGPAASVIYIGYAAALVLMAANIVRILLILFGKPREPGTEAETSKSWIFVAYISFFLLAAAAAAVIAVLGNAGLQQGGLEIWGKSFDLFRNGN